MAVLVFPENQSSINIYSDDVLVTPKSFQIQFQEEINICRALINVAI